MGKYEDEMGIVVEALRIASLMIQALPGDTLEELEKTVTAADNMAFLIVPPLAFDGANKRLDDQRKVLQWARETVDVFESMRPGAEGGATP